MFKKLLLFSALGLMAISCTLVKEDRISCNFTVPVNVRLTGFSFVQEDFPHTKVTETPANYSAVNAVTLAFYQGDTEIYKSTQLKSEAPAFGTFSLSLPIGSYTMVAIAHTTKEESPFVLTSPTVAAYTGEHAYETFTCTQTVNITDTNAVDISATLNRIISMLTVCSSDGKASNAKSISMTFSAGAKSFNPTTGLATANTTFTNTVSISAEVGETSASSTAFFLLTDEQEMDVTISVLDADDNVLYTTTVENVPFKRNRKTKLTGKLYSAESAGSFLLNQDWIDMVQHSF